ncbi:MAG: acyl-CoA dehydrogenase family protein [Candidatus Hydrogenedentota bacterium]|nr:MAG: acyl-CoA dehydrogenase family protein [Candidatus Hydrogenedentota bacterium]
MAITEATAGSDTAAIMTTATRDGDSWVFNGEKVFVTSGKTAAEESDGFVVIWATIDGSAGRVGIKSFVVEKGTPGMAVTHVCQTAVELMGPTALFARLPARKMGARLQN